jgi:hypothetical protein
MIAQALMNRPFAQSDTNVKPMMDMALARIRQLSAHEVGHTIGFTHNFAASTNNRASVMDYPHPTLNLKDGEIDFSNAYATGIGDWDKVTVAYSYGDVPEGTTEEKYLREILDTAFNSGLRFITDSDARAQGGAHAKAHLWDNGIDATSELLNVLEVRKQAIANFSMDNIRSGEPLTVLEDVFVPLYFFHRYQTEAAIKTIGGMEYDYTIKNHEGGMPRYLAAEEQKNALKAVLSTLDTKNLMIPKEQLSLFPPRAYGYGRSRESFKSDLGVAFDALGAAATSADMTLKLLLNPQRVNRLIQQNALDSKNLGFKDILEGLPLNKPVKAGLDKYEQELAIAVRFVTLNRLFHLLANKDVLPQVKGMINTKLDNLVSGMDKDDVSDRELARMIKQFREDPSEYKMTEVPDIPDGSPIGMDCAGPNYNH